MSLIQAITKLELKFHKKVTAIQFEDGSGFKFNVQFDYGPWQFVNLN